MFVLGLDPGKDWGVALVEDGGDKPDYVASCGFTPAPSQSPLQLLEPWLVNAVGRPCGLTLPDGRVDWSRVLVAAVEAWQWFGDSERGRGIAHQAEAYGYWRGVFGAWGVRVITLQPRDTRTVLRLKSNAPKIAVFQAAQFILDGGDIKAPNQHIRDAVALAVAGWSRADFSVASRR